VFLPCSSSSREGARDCTHACCGGDGSEFIRAIGADAQNACNENGGCGAGDYLASYSSRDMGFGDWTDSCGCVDSDGERCVSIVSYERI
jgi:hypothetical protein